MFLSDADVQRDTQLCVVHPTIAVKVSNMIAMRFFLSLLAILFNFSMCKDNAIFSKNKTLKIYLNLFCIVSELSYLCTQFIKKNNEEDNKEGIKIHILYSSHVGSGIPARLLALAYRGE